MEPAGSECLGADTLLDLFEGRASAEQRAMVEAHASRCAECRRVLSSLARNRAPAGLEPATAVERPDQRMNALELMSDAHDPLDELAPGAMVARYVVRARLGAGGMGVVYAAFDPELGREVAIKVLAPGLGSSAASSLYDERLRREARALAQLAHPNVVAIYDVGRVGERVFIAMELLDGDTLARWCRGERRSPRVILDHFVAAGRGLAAAHRTGIVHRDVKPENMMLGKDGRVRVVDFGLARAAGAADLEIGGGPKLFGALTATGAVMGTPHYMAPEQHRGEEVDARTDQFAFCVALYGALYDTRPFAGDDLESLARAVEAGELREPPRRHSIPRRVWRALRRGMAPLPAARFATLDELLEQLAHVRGSRWTPIAAWVAVATVAATVLAITARSGAPRPCEDMVVHLAGVWDAPRREKLVDAIHATGAPFADATARTVAVKLDDYAARWVAARGEACTATRVRGDQTEETMGLGMACLDDRLQEVDALVDRLLTVDRASVGRAVAAAYDLTDLTACANVTSLHYRAQPARDPALVASVRAQLADARALEVTGRFREGLASVAAVAPLVASAGYRPLEAEAALLEGMLRNDAASPDAAIAALERAVLAAEASGYDQIAAEALIELVHLHGARAKFVAAEAARARATAALERMGHAPERSADLDYAAGTVAFVRGDLTGAEAMLARALHTAEALHGTADLRVAATLVMLGQVELRRMNGAAGPYLERARLIEEHLLGPDHPDPAVVELALGGAAYEQGQNDAAAAHYERAIAILELALGRENVRIANALSNLALVRQWQGRTEDALAEIREAVAIDAKLLSAADPDVAAHLVTEADVLEQLGRHAEALAVTDRALAIFHTLYGADHQDIADALQSRALIGLASNNLERALVDGRAALAMFGRVNPTFPTMELLRTLGQIELSLHHSGVALTYFEDALRHPRLDRDAAAVAWLNALYGRALVETKRDRGKGIALVTAGYLALRADPRTGGEWHELERWMRLAGVPVPRVPSHEDGVDAGR
ncbi:hypothetical protein BH11MYX1_BH11MYX1_31410 [soil metagenome]